MKNELAVTIDGINQRLSLLRGDGGQEQEATAAATATATALPSSFSLLPEKEQEARAGGGYGDDGDDGGGGGGGGPSGADNPTGRSCAGSPPTRFVAGDTCLAPRVFDRRRARAVVEEVLPGDSGTCLVTWLHPRQRGELVCRYWKEVRRGGGGVVCVFRRIELASWLLPLFVWRSGMEGRGGEGRERTLAA